MLLAQRLFILDPEKHAAFLNALDNPPPAGTKLKALMGRFGRSNPTSGKRAGMTAPTLLKPTHDFSRFGCGNEALNDWLKNRSLESEGKTARTYVVCEDNVIIGYTA